MHAKVVALFFCLSLVETGVYANYGGITANRGKNTVNCGCWNLEYSCNREQDVRKLDFVRLTRPGCHAAGEELSRMISNNPRMYKDGPDNYQCKGGNSVVEFGTQDHDNDVCIDEELRFLNGLCEKAKTSCGPITANKGKNTVKAGCWTMEYSCNAEQEVKKLDFVKLTRQGHSKASEKLNQMISNNPRMYKDGPDKLTVSGGNTVIEYGTQDHDNDVCTGPEIQFLTRLHHEALGACGTDPPPPRPIPRPIPVPTPYGPVPTPPVPTPPVPVPTPYGPVPTPPVPIPIPTPGDIVITSNKGKNTVKAGCWDLEYSCNAEQPEKKLDFVRLTRDGCHASGDKLSKMISDNPRMYKDGPDNHQCKGGKSVVEFGTQDHDNDVCTEPEINFLRNLATEAKRSCGGLTVHKGKNTHQAGCWTLEFSCNAEQPVKKLDFVRLTRDGCHHSAEKLSQMISNNPRMYKDGPDKLECKGGKTVIEYGTQDHDNDVCIDQEVAFLTNLSQEAGKFCGVPPPSAY